VLKDEEEAYKWYGIAARIGDADAARLRDTLKAGLDGKTVARLDREIASWKPARPLKEGKPPPHHRNRNARSTGRPASGAYRNS